jgi:hypothetical protein
MTTYILETDLDDTIENEATHELTDDDMIMAQDSAGPTNDSAPEITKIYDFVYDGHGERLDVYLTRVQ